MKRIIRPIRSLLTALLLLLLIGVMAAPASAKTNYKKIYGKLLKKSSINYKDEDGHKLTYQPFAFVLINLDRKGPKELIVTNEYYSEWHIYTIKNNKAKHVFSKGWMGSNTGVYYNKKKRGLVRIWSDGTGLINRCLFCFKNGKQNSRIHLYSSWIYNTDPAEFNYTLNGKGISKSKFMKYYNAYFKYTKVNGDLVYNGTKYYPFIANTAYNRTAKLK